MDSRKNQKIIAIVGPTASGKTSLSIELAKEFSGVIISADSRQVYRELNIGTEKVTEEEMQGIPHHVIDVVDPDQSFTVSDFKSLANGSVIEIASHGNIPFLVGGTGFYVDALLYDQEFPTVEPNEKLRTELEEKDSQELFKMLIEKDPKRATTIDPQNKRRLVRALEIIEALGEVPEQDKKELVYDALIIGIKTDMDALRKRIESRLEETIQNGLVQEVADLHSRGITWEQFDEFGLEYRIAGEFLRKEININEMYTKMVHALNQYAKRQMTWFKRNEDIEWFELEEYAQIEKRIRDFLG